jgi:hypothetical protein
MAHELPNHVSKHLKDSDVDPDKLPNKVKEALASLSEDEIAVLQTSRDSLLSADADKNLIAKVH